MSTPTLGSTTTEPHDSPVQKTPYLYYLFCAVTVTGVLLPRTAVCCAIATDWLSLLTVQMHLFYSYGSVGFTGSPSFFWCVLALTTIIGGSTVEMQ